MDGGTGLKLLSFLKPCSPGLDLTPPAQVSGREVKALESEDLSRKNPPHPSTCSRGWLLTLKKQICRNLPLHASVACECCWLQTQLGGALHACLLKGSPWRGTLWACCCPLGWQGSTKAHAAKAWNCYSVPMLGTHISVLRRPHGGSSS